MIDQLEQEVEMTERHVEILLRVIEHEPIGIVKLANQSGYEHHKVRYSLRILEGEELIKSSPEGAITTERTEEFVNEFDDRLATLVDRLTTMKIGDSIESNH